MALRVGFVGVGGIAQRHLTYCQQREDVDIVGHADVVFERAEKASADFGGRAYDSHDKLYAAEQPQALVICTPLTPTATSRRPPATSASPSSWRSRSR